MLASVLAKQWLEEIHMGMSVTCNKHRVPVHSFLRKIPSEKGCHQETTGHPSSRRFGAQDERQARGSNTHLWPLCGSRKYTGSPSATPDHTSVRTLSVPSSQPIEGWAVSLNEMHAVHSQVPATVHPAYAGCCGAIGTHCRAIAVSAGN